MKVIYEDVEDIQMECDRLEDELHYLYKLEAIREKFYKLRKDYKKLQKENIDLINKLNKEKNKTKKADEEIERLNKIKELTKMNIQITIDIIKEQPTVNDEWLLERLNGILKVLDKEE